MNVWLPLTHPQLGPWPVTQAYAPTGNRTTTLCFSVWRSIHWTTPVGACGSYYDFRMHLSKTIREFCGTRFINTRVWTVPSMPKSLTQWSHGVREKKWENLGLHLYEGSRVGFLVSWVHSYWQTWSMRAEIRVQEDRGRITQAMSYLSPRTFGRRDLHGWEQPTSLSGCHSIVAASCSWQYV